MLKLGAAAAAAAVLPVQAMKDLPAAAAEHIR
jgi:hypothetical protein